MATKYYTGAASPLAYKCTLTVGGTWAAADTITVTINGKNLVLTLGSAGISTTADVADKLHRAVNATSHTNATENDETRNIGGQQIPELSGLPATVSGSVVTLTGIMGVPYAVPEAVSSSAGTGAPATVQTATGPNHWDNTANWSSGSVPVDGDTVVFDHRAQNASCAFGLPQADADLNLAELHITESYQSQIGLPTTNAMATRYYPEYRDRYLHLYGESSESTIITIGGKDSGGNGPMMININHDDNGSASANVKAVIHRTGTKLEGERAAVNLELGASSVGNSVIVHSGSVAMGEPVTSTTAQMTLDELVIDSGGDVYLTEKVGFTGTAPRFIVTGGRLYCESRFTRDLTLRDAVTTLRAGASAKLYVFGGTLDFSPQSLHGDIANVRPEVIQQSGKINFENSAVKLNFVGCNWTCYGGATIVDRNQTMTYPAIACPNGIGNVNFNFGGGATITPLTTDPAGHGA